MNYSEKMQEMAMEMDFRKYVEALKEERRKITVFQRELPLCLELITQAIESWTQQLSGTTTECFNGVQSDSSDQTSGECPVLEEFMPVKRGLSSDSMDEERESFEMRKKEVGQSDWLKSAQLWNPDPDVRNSPKTTVVVVAKKNGGAFQPFHRDKTTVENGQPATVICTGEKASQSSSRREEKEEHGKRKLRRSWSPELHRRFLNALQQLGGSHVATPKQIRELMKVDGLTNDEVKSHLQKYRLHATRSSPVHNNGVKQSPQYVLAGGIWVPPSEYAVAPATTVAGDGNEFYVVPTAVSPDGQLSAVKRPAGNEFYVVPTAVSPDGQLSAVKRPEPKRSVQSRVVVSHGGDDGAVGGRHSNSPATSSSTHTSTASPEL